MKYNSHEKFNSSGTGGTPIMTKGRATTYDERVEIVEDYNNHRYQKRLNCMAPLEYRHYLLISESDTPETNSSSGWSLKILEQDYPQ